MASSAVRAAASSILQSIQALQLKGFEPNTGHSAWRAAIRHLSALIGLKSIKMMAPTTTTKAMMQTAIVSGTKAVDAGAT